MASLTSYRSGLSGKRVVFCAQDGMQDIYLRHILPRADLLIVGEANTGADTLLLVSRERPDIVLLDTPYLDTDMSEVIRAILEVCPLCLVLLTCDLEVEERAAQLGVSACLAKPFKAETLLACLQRALIPAY